MSCVVHDVGDAPRVPWGNGLGVSRELLASRLPGADATDAAAVTWRLATTAITADCPFSSYPACDRTIVLWRGAGFTLVFDDRPAGRVVAPGDHIVFPGDVGTRCTLTAGPVEVINVMTARGRIRHQVTMLRGAADLHAADAAPPALRLLMRVAGEVGCGPDGRFASCAEADGVERVVVVPAGERLPIAPEVFDSPAVILCVQLDPGGG